ncbi:5'/3'-nucleotidase SurE [Cellulomonas chengniuliangii]|uniref:5'-nucleotidase n=1 Tax=Cellulomonas chengniuliangii TaxID=2968084 RepID=A0ABY5KYM2_9CELL|nr:5'/3'-nucleotidase SurE [Cellulomonas chengniuliangii]MCC2307597.1 5'/3'-nucleotidase SurE [Cellulomonas chengniuliangii]UUI75635.1 5'/3'-nucleotidase SurE [Cellulomonas chengniuliangii]
MRVLVTNDDGIASPGLALLARAALAIGAEVLVAAPSDDQSGSSASLVGAEWHDRLVGKDVRAPDVPDVVRCLAMDATPGLIVLAAARGRLGLPPDLVLSGVNRGPNLGRAVVHSGTVGAAFTAATHGIEGLAVSLASPQPDHWGTAERCALAVLRGVVAAPVGGRVLNLNVPDRPADQVRGIRRARLAPFGSAQAHVEVGDGGDVVVTYSQPDASADDDTDSALLARGWATLTVVNPPTSDDTAALPDVGTWPPG